MGKQLVFRYGTMNSGKSIDILKVAHNYEEQGKKVMLFTTSIDDRNGVGNITSRIGISKPALLINDNVFETVKNENPHCVICDEVQFYSTYIIEELARIVDELSIPVLCYGLRTNFQSFLFEGSKRLFELADKVEEIKTMCWYSDTKATMNMRLLDGQPVFDGQEVQIGGNESYVPVSRKVFMEQKNLK